MASFECFVCSAPFSVDTKKLIKHLRRDHAMFDGLKLNLKCCYRQCELSFQSYSGFSKHLSRHFKFSELSITSKNVSTQEELYFANSVEISPNIADQSRVEKNLRSQTPILLDRSNDSWICDDDSIDDPLPSRTNVLLKLESTGIPKSSLDAEITATNEILLGALDDVSSILKDDKMECNRLNEYLEKQRNLLKSNNSKFKRQAHYSNLKHFVQPVETEIGTSYDQRYDRVLKTYKTVALPCKMAYIPILETICFILTDPGARRAAFAER